MPQVKSSVPPDCPRNPTFRCQWKIQVVTSTSDQPATNWDSHDPFLGLDNLLEQNSGKHLCLVVYYIIKNSIKDTHCQMKSYDWEGSQELLAPGVGVHHPPRTWMWSPTWKLSEPYMLEIFMEALSYTHGHSLTQSLVHLPITENGVGRMENSKLLIKAWSFW